MRLPPVGGKDSNGGQAAFQRCVEVCEALNIQHVHCQVVNAKCQTAHLTYASVGGKDDNGGQAAFQGSVEVCEALDVQHVHLINEEHTRH